MKNECTMAPSISAPSATPRDDAPSGFHLELPEVNQETQLITSTRRGDVQAFTELVRLHQGRVRAFLGRFQLPDDVVDDIAQETFVGAFRGIASYKGQAPLSTWLCAIAKNQAMIYLRRKTTQARREGGNLEARLNDLVEKKTADEAPEHADGALSALQQCLGSLPRLSARLVREFYFEEQNALAIGKRLGRSENAIRLLLFRIRKQLRSCIEARVAAGGTSP